MQTPLPATHSTPSSDSCVASARHDRVLARDLLLHWLDSWLMCPLFHCAPLWRPSPRPLARMQA